MRSENNPQCEQIIHRALTAQTLPEIEAAAQALREWIRQHPDDLNAEDALEPLAMLRRGLQSGAEKSIPAGVTS